MTKRSRRTASASPRCVASASCPRHESNHAFGVVTGSSREMDGCSVPETSSSGSRRSSCKLLAGSDADDLDRDVDVDPTTRQLDHPPGEIDDGHRLRPSRA